MTSAHQSPQSRPALTAIPQRIIRYVSAAAVRIFSPTDDEYPATGIQPFDGDIPDENSMRSQSW